MEHQLPQCRVILEPLTPSGNKNVGMGIPVNGKNGLVPSRTKSNLEECVAERNVICNISDECKSRMSCLIKLENVNTCSKISEKSNIENTTNSISKEAESPHKSKTKYSWGSSEAVTPKANIEFSLELRKAINERNILTSKTKKRVFDALDEIKNKTEEESRNFKREKALLEIINSEIKYIHQLEIIINFFIKPTKERKLLKPDDFDILFRNINPIYNINKELLDELHKGIENIPKAFSKIAPFLKLYSVYAYDFKNSIKILQNARLLNPQFAKFLEDQETRPEVQNKLSALLITPIQRVPRYKLLLTNIYNLTKPSEKGFDILSDCLGKIENVAEHINKVIEDEENMQRLLEFQRCLRGEPNVIMPGRKLIREGILTKMSMKDSSSEKLYVVLMNDIILFSKMKKDEPKVNSLKCLSIFPLNKCRVIEILDKGCLKIICVEEELILYHNQFSETKEWIKVIKETIDEHLKDRKTLRKESSARRPVKRKDLHEYHEIGLSPGRPLKKRKCVLDTESTNTNAVNRKILRRRPIRDTSESNCENVSLPQTSSLEEPFLNTDNHIRENGEQAVDVFVFGKSNNRDESKIFKFLGGLGNSFKKFLGFKN